MIILYIPFYEANDLIQGAQEWMKNYQNKNQSIEIIQHNPNSSVDFLIPQDRSLVIYILGHNIKKVNITQDLQEIKDLSNDLSNIDNNVITEYILHTEKVINNAEQFIYSHANNPLTALSMGELAERFQMDFSFYQHQIQKTKLYFCNSKNEKDHAIEFKNQIIAFNKLKIDYYHGNLYAYSFKSNGKVAQLSNKSVDRASRMRSSIYINDIKFENSTVKLFKQKKSLPTLTSLEERRKNNLQHRKKERKALYKTFRNL